MKKYTILAAVLVLTATVFAGCRSRKPESATIPPTETLMPTIMPTEEATMPTTVVPTENYTDATENPGTIPGDADTTMGTDETGGTTPTDDTSGAGENRARRRNVIPGAN